MAFVRKLMSITLMVPTFLLSKCIAFPTLSYDVNSMEPPEFMAPLLVFELNDDEHSEHDINDVVSNQDSLFGMRLSFRKMLNDRRKALLLKLQPTIDPTLISDVDSFEPLEFMSPLLVFDDEHSEHDVDDVVSNQDSLFGICLSFRKMLNDRRKALLLKPQPRFDPTLSSDVDSLEPPEFMSPLLVFELNDDQHSEHDVNGVVSNQDSLFGMCLSFTKMLNDRRKALDLPPLDPNTSPKLVYDLFL